MNDPLFPVRQDSDEDSAWPAAPPAVVCCWRCGKEVLATIACCPYCAAALAKESRTPRKTAPDGDTQSLIRLLYFFAALLGTSVVGGLWLHFKAEAARGPAVTPHEQLLFTIFFEAVDAGLIFGAWAMIRLRPAEARPSAGRRVLAWGFSLPALAVMLLLNVAYHRLLIQWLDMPLDDMAFLQDRSSWAVWAVAICVQPAVIEELFFRYLMFRGLRPVMGGHAVVWVTAVMFMLAHIGAPLSMPILLMLGVLLGYARLASGGIYLPMALHFFHNATVMILEAKLL